MSVDQPNVVDIIGLKKETGEVFLTISDHLDWSDSPSHQAILQEKFNRYLAFVESGEILERYPDARDRKLVFEVVFKFRPDREGMEFLARAREVIQPAGFALQHRVFAESYDN